MSWLIGTRQPSSRALVPTKAELLHFCVGSISQLSPQISFWIERAHIIRLDPAALHAHHHLAHFLQVEIGGDYLFEIYLCECAPGKVIDDRYAEGNAECRYLTT